MVQFGSDAQTPRSGSYDAASGHLRSAGPGPAGGARRSRTWPGWPACRAGQSPECSTAAATCARPCSTPSTRRSTRSGYSVNQAARNLARGHTGSIAFVISDREESLFEDPNFGLFVRVFSRQLRQNGRHLLLTMAQDEEEENFLGDYLTLGHVDGALLALTHDGSRCSGGCCRTGCPWW